VDALTKTVNLDLFSELEAKMLGKPLHWSIFCSLTAIWFSYPKKRGPKPLGLDPLFSLLIPQGIILF